MKGYIKPVFFTGLFVAMFFLVPSGNGEARGFQESHLPRYYSQLQVFLDHAREEKSATEEEIEIFEYKIQPGDTLFTIAHRHGTDVETLVHLNRISNPHYINPGETIEVITATGVVHTVQSGETWEQIARRYQVGADEILGINGARKDNLRSGERIVITGSRGMETAWRSPVQPSFIWPVQGRITSRFGWRNRGFHYGLDVAAPTGTVVRAAASGVVTYASFRGNYGLLVEIDHGHSWFTRYAHNSRALVGVGQKVNQGQAVSLVGATGDATGPHVHIEIITKGEKVDPLNYLPK